MWSRAILRSAVVALGLSLTLSGCGFKPIYGEDAPASATHGMIAVDQIDGRMGFNLRERLTARLGPATQASYRLGVDVDVSSQGLAISSTNEITRYNLTGSATYTLTSISDGLPVMRGNVRAFSAYSATASTFATSVAEVNARERLANSLAEQIALRLAATADRWSQ